MKIISVCELDAQEAAVVESNSNTKIRDEVFERVKRLFHLTSNKKKIWNNMTNKIKLMETRANQLDKVETKLMAIQSKLKQDTDELRKKLFESSKLLESSLKGGS